MANKKIIPIQGGTEITYRGKELNQTDLDIWLTIKKIWLENKCERVILNTRQVLHAMRLNQRQGDRDWLKEKIIDIASGSIIYDSKQYGGFVGHLMDIVWSHDFKDFAVDFNPLLLNLFEENSFTYLDLEMREALNGDLAKWLYNYYRSNDACFSVYDHTLQDLCGSQASKYKFRKQLKAAGEELVRTDFLEYFLIERSGLVKAQKRAQLELVSQS